MPKTSHTDDYFVRTTDADGKTITTRLKSPTKSTEIQVSVALPPDAIGGRVYGGDAKKPFQTIATTGHVLPGTATTRTLAAIRFLATGPRRPMELAAELGITRRSVERLIVRLKAGGINIVTERSWHKVTYRIARPGEAP
jgi:biotin operon repressor